MGFNNIDRYVIYTDFDGKVQKFNIVNLVANRKLRECKTTSNFTCSKIEDNKVSVLLPYTTDGSPTKVIKGQVTVFSEANEVITIPTNIRVIDITIGIDIGGFNLRLLLVAGVIVGALIFANLNKPTKVRIKIN